jgi:hypothetical protein
VPVHVRAEKFRFPEPTLAEQLQGVTCANATFTRINAKKARIMDFILVRYKFVGTGILRQGKEITTPCVITRKGFLVAAS